MQTLILVVGFLVVNFFRVVWFSAAVFFAIHLLRFVGAL